MWDWLGLIQLQPRTHPGKDVKKCLKMSILKNIMKLPPFCRPTSFGSCSVRKKTSEYSHFLKERRLTCGSFKLGDPITHIELLHCLAAEPFHYPFSHLSPHTKAKSRSTPMFNACRTNVKKTSHDPKANNPSKLKQI
jgi:hypothetical protein